MQYLLDTNICVFFLRGKLNLDDLIKQKRRENCFISEISVFELRYGAENSNDLKKSNKAVDVYRRTFNSSNLWLNQEVRKRKGET